MQKNVSEIILGFSQKLKQLLGEKLSKVILYGSYARGNYHENSDVDVMILVKMTEKDIKQIKNEIYDLASDIELDTGIDISPVIKSETQYEYWADTVPFYANVKKEGIVVNE